MITIIADGIPIRHVECPKGQEDIQCLNGESWVEGKVPFMKELSYKNSIEYKINCINKEFESSISKLYEDIPNVEVSTWERQEAEAKLFLENPEANTPLLDSICSSRGDNKVELANKIVLKATLYIEELGKLIGKRQTLVKEIKGK